jgi:hypothetical protein
MMPKNEDVYMAWSIVAGIGSAAVSVASTVMAPICEKWHQSGIMQSGVACQAANLTSCWHEGRLVNIAGIASRALYVFGPGTGVMTGLILGDRVCPAGASCVKRDICCTIALFSTALILDFAAATVSGVATLQLAASYAEPTAYSIGVECINRTFVNVTTCQALEEQLGIYNMAATASWVVCNAAFTSLGFLVGHMLSPCSRKARNYEVVN